MMCEKCVHRLICERASENTDFKFPKKNDKCDMLNTGLDDVEETVSILLLQAKEYWDEAKEDTYDRTKAAFQKGRWSAFKDVLDILSTKVW